MNSKTNIIRHRVNTTIILFRENESQATTATLSWQKLYFQCNVRADLLFTQRYTRRVRTLYVLKFNFQFGNIIVRGKMKLERSANAAPRRCDIAPKQFTKYT